MAGQFSIVWPKRRGPSDPWFRVGTVDATTATLGAALAVVSFFVYALDKSLLQWLAFSPDRITHGQIWRLATWPALNEPQIFTALAIGIFWWVGNRLEMDFGRIRFLKFLITCTLAPAIFATGYYYATGGLTYENAGSLVSIASQGIGLLVWAVLVAFIVENPNMRSFFGIKAWILASVLFGINMLQLLGDRYFLAVVFELLMVGCVLILVRAYGLGTNVSWVPLVRLPQFIISDGSGKKAKVRPTKPARSKPASSKGKGEPIVGPWAGSGSGPAATATQHDVDRILDKIAASGMNSLTPAEKATLEAASRARRDKNS